MFRQRLFQFLRKAARFSLKAGIAMAFLLVVLEIAYRNQWIDTYKAQLLALNDQATLESKDRTILVLGDSFSASDASWVGTFRKQMPGFRVVNCATTGTGIVQANIIAHKRFPQFKPDLLIYQIYTGNDLADYRYPISWSKLNPFRNLYWWFAHRFRSLAWINQALGQAKSKASPEALLPTFNAAFSPQAYTPREKLLLQAEPGLIEHQAFLRGGREDDMKGYLRRMDDILALCAEFGTVPYLLVLPHCAQVSEGQKRNMAALGAEFSSEWSTSPDYPFLNRIAGHTQGRATVLNPLPAFQAAEATGKQLYFNNDPHLNAAGQEMLGEWVKSAIQGMELPRDPNEM
jgi:hypothetical protein